MENVVKPIVLELTTKNPPTVEQLRKAGHKVRIIHQRYKFQDIKKVEKLMAKGTKLRDLPKIPSYPRREIIDSNDISAKGGLTIIELTTPQRLNYRAEAACFIKDSFNRKLAVKICLGRIIRDMIAFNAQDAQD
jgi:hypothetical protein